ncbi:MAG: bifunctional hydroxymethylpyrimidine kinase/phosphomethylpyrimidine kinase [Janthinobacterium lividum]
MGHSYAEVMDASSTSPAVLTIAGFDPSSGAGITADLAVFAAHGCFGISAVTALTVQSTLGVQRVQPVDAHLLADTLACLEADLPPAGIKIGMLADEPQVQVVIDYLTKLRNEGRQPYVVLDPVLISSSGRELLSSAGRTRLLQDLLPLVQVATPNTDELKQLTGMASSTEHEIEAASIYLNKRHLGLSILATGGDREHPDDTLLHAGVVAVLRGTRVVTSATHGTGCALSSALLCGLVNGKPLAEAARAAKNYVEGAMRRAEPRGGGKGPMALLWPLSGHTEL